MTTSTINTADAKEQFADLISRVAHNKERIILSRRGKDIAAIVPLEDLSAILTSQHKADLRDAVESLKNAREHGMISIHDVKDELG